jgi:hypothetical protein
MKRALIDIRDNTVVQVEPLDGTFPVSPDYAWIDCPDAVLAYSWTYDGTTFSPPAPPSLDSLKTAKNAQIERDRDTAIATTVTVHGRPWQARPIDQDNLSQELLTVQAGVPMSPIWRDADNNDMVLTDVAQLVAIAGAMKVQKLLAYQTAWARKAALAAATTVDEIEAI